jgi:hypothetical protein
LWRIVAALAGVPLVGRLLPHVAAGRPPAPVDPEDAPAADVPATPGEDHPGARARTVHNLKFIAWAMHHFTRASGGRLPAATIRRDGKALLSWRVAILPFLEEAALYERFHLDEPWDSPHNRALLKEMPRAYAPVRRQNAAPYATYYQALVGPGALFDGGEGTQIRDFIAVARPALMVVEAAHPVPWTKPEDVPYNRGKPLPPLGGQFDDGLYAAFAEGSVRFIGRKVAVETIHALVSGGASQVNTADQLGPRL